VSKLADKIRRCSRIEPMPIGFGSARAATSPTMVLIGVARDARAAADLARRGADAVLIGGKDGDAGALDGQLGEAAPGSWISARTSSMALRDAGYDFGVFDPDRTPSTAVLEEKLGYVLVLPRDVSDVELRAVETFDLDAIDVGTLDAGLTVRKQIDLRRIYALARKPLMAAVPADITVQQLQALRDTNVVVVAAEGGDHVEKLRKTIDALPPRSRRREEDRPMPMIPRSAPGAEETEEDDD
jgi:hypothetical protein